uniref:Serpin domain-containing protein n=1 Tax=Heliothis virescens TaxID=7102 RepID=A0A2A4J224_HELVI
MRKLSLALLLVCCCVPILTQHDQRLISSLVYDPRTCIVNEDLIYNYRSAIYSFSISLFRPVAFRSNLNFVFSPLSIWIMLAAMAEGAEPLTQQKLFQLLNLPNDPCIRQLYYQLATTRAFPTNDVNIKSTRVLLINDGTILSPSWYDVVVKNSLLEVITAPMRYNPTATANEIKRIMSARLPRLDLSGNSVLLDTMDYNGLWTTAFADAVVEQAPFYDIEGKQTGTVDIMRVKRRARMGYVKKLNAKVIELPFGADERYRMLFSVVIGKADLRPIVSGVTKELVFEVFAALRHSYVQIDVAIPRMVITSEVDVRTVLEDLGVQELWSDPSVTRYISNPPAHPSSFVQRSTVVINNTGLYSEPQEPQPPPGVRTGLEPILGTDFVADRPFLFGLIDAETNSILLAAAFSRPTYPL